MHKFGRITDKCRRDTHDLTTQESKSIKSDIMTRMYDLNGTALKLHMQIAGRC